MTTPPSDDGGARDAIGPESESAARFRDLQTLHRSLAHDLRGPLNTIVLELELLRSDLVESRSAESSRLRIERLGREVGELRSGLERLLSLLAPPGTQGPGWDAVELASAVARLLAPQARLRGVALELAAASRPLLASGDRGDVLAALLRLALEGLTALPEHSRFAIAALEGETVGDVAFRVESFFLLRARNHRHTGICVE